MTFSRRSFFGNLLRGAAIAVAANYAPSLLKRERPTLADLDAAMAQIEAMNEEMTHVLFYGHSAPAAEFTGLTARYSIKV